MKISTSIVTLFLGGTATEDSGKEINLQINKESIVLNYAIQQVEMRYFKPTFIVARLVYFPILLW